MSVPCNSQTEPFLLEYYKQNLTWALTLRFMVIVGVNDGAFCIFFALKHRDFVSSKEHDRAGEWLWPLGNKKWL